MAKTNLNRKISELENEINGSPAQPISAALNRAVEEMFFQTGAQGAAIALRDSEGVLCIASTGLAPTTGSRLPPESGFTRECFESGQIVLCEDAEDDPRIRPEVARSLHLGAALAVPILRSNSVLGVLLVFSSRPFAFDTVHVAILQRIAQSLPYSSGSAAVMEDRHLTQVPPPTDGRAADQSLSPSQDLINVPQSPAWEEPASSLDSLNAAGRHDREPAAIRSWIVAGLVLFLLLLLLFGLSHHKSAKPVPDRVIPAASDSSSLDATRNRATVETLNGKKSDGVSHAEGLPSSIGEGDRAVGEIPNGVAAQSRGRGLEQSRPLVLTLPNPSDRLANKPASKSVTEAINPTSPVLMIKGAPIGARIFIDNQLASSVDSDSQVEIPRIAAGQHHLRVTFNGYRDYEQEVDLLAGQTFAVVAKLEPSDLAVSSGRYKSPIFEIAPAAPEPVRSLKLSTPDFVLDHTIKAHSGWITAVAFSVDGQRLASGSWERGVRFWNPITGQELSTTAKIKEVEAIAFSSDGRWFATENSANTLTLFDATTGEAIRTFNGNKPLGVLGTNWVYSIAFSPDGRWLASGVDNKTVRLWDVQTGNTIRDLVSLRRPVIYIAFSPDGRWLASGADDKSIEIWDVITGKPIRKLTGHKKTINAVAFSPNGKCLASASVDKSIKLWDALTGSEIHTLVGHGDLVTSLAFSPDGLWLASGSWDNTIKIWNVATGQEVRSLAGNNHHIYAVAFDPKGRWLASGSEDGAIELWQWEGGVDQSRVR